ncbi:xanthan lyase [Virgibacillus indicus]|uniref:Xanthan lyase n=1 Tax=Virgibacillus indicus TaxID=2024554 RepID=A0A265N8K5_9BACI|nr:FAD-dependent oxidoreductase [Virgibacillus indicus]OZU88348.1 xanthan lyase [Virgibacillus indicus]
MDNYPSYYEPLENGGNPKLNIERDLVVYGATPAGITAAIQAKQMGLSVVIAEFSNHIGGITANGLGATDFGAKDAIGGLSREFYRRIGKYYGKEEQWTFEPKAAKYVFEKWLEENNIPVYKKQHLRDAVMEGTEIKSIMMENGNMFSGKHFIDASYEGDLMSKVNVSYFIGRESNGTYQEIYNGVQFGYPHHKFETDIDPYVIKGDESSGLLPGIEEKLDKQEKQGEGDGRIQAYNFRICLTKDTDKKISFPKPKDYDPGRYELLLRYIKAGVWDAMNLHTALPNGKTDLNNYGAFSTDNIGMNYEWPEGSYETREEIFQDHVSYNLGLLYFLANDPEVPEHVKNEAAEWGLPADEFVETGNWPAQLYIREARRMISDYVMTDNNCLAKTTVKDSIGLASYQMDSHHVRRVVVDGKCENEGDVEIPISPYPVSYQSIRPKAEECTNLLVPVCLSSSHIAYGSIRMEPVFMIIGQSAGAAAGLALKNNIDVQDIDYFELKNVLTEAGQVLHWDESIEDDPRERMKQTFGKE